MRKREGEFAILAQAVSAQAPSPPEKELNRAIGKLGRGLHYRGFFSTPAPPFDHQGILENLRAFLQGVLNRGPIMNE